MPGLLSSHSSPGWQVSQTCNYLKVLCRYTVCLSSLCYSLSLSNISPTHPTSPPPALVVSLIGVFVSFMLKVETRASQVQLVCLHVTHSSVAETLMHRSFKTDKCLKKRKEKKKHLCFCCSSQQCVCWKWFPSFKIMQIEMEKILSSGFVYMCSVINSSLHDVNWFVCKLDWRI